MSDQLFFGLTLLTTSSVLLVIYSGHASSRGMQQGTFFAGGKAMLLGFAGLLTAAVIAFTKDGLFSMLIVGGLSIIIFSPVALAVLRVNSQIASIFGFLIGLIISLSSKG